MQVKTRSAVLILKNDKILLIERNTADKPVYYVLPGGGVEAGETVEQAAVREMKEELGVDIEIKSKEKDPLQTDRETWIIRAELKPENEPQWLETHKQTPENYYAVVWLSIDSLKDLAIFPESVINIVYSNL